MTNRFYDLTFEHLASGTIRLKQSAFDEDCTIDLHPAQLEHVAQALLGACDPGRVRELERRLAVLDERIADLVLDDSIRTEIIERCGSGIEIILRLDALYDLGVEFTVGLTPDRGQLTPGKPAQDGRSGEEFRSVFQPIDVSSEAAPKPINEPTKNTAAQPDAGQLF